MANLIVKRVNPIMKSTHSRGSFYEQQDPGNISLRICECCEIKDREYWFFFENAGVKLIKKM